MQMRELHDDTHNASAVGTAIQLANCQCEQDIIDRHSFVEAQQAGFSDLLPLVLFLVISTSFSFIFVKKSNKNKQKQVKNLQSLPIFLKNRSFRL